MNRKYYVVSMRVTEIGATYAWSILDTEHDLETEQGINDMYEDLFSKYGTKDLIVLNWRELKS